MNRPRISVILPVHAKAPRLRLTWAALLPQLDAAAAELIIVADGATDPVLEIAQQTPAKVVCTPGLGRGAARNRGASHARAELLLFLDDDILTMPDFVTAHLDAQHLESAYLHGRLREIPGLARVQDPRSGGVGCPPIDEQALAGGRWNPERCRLAASALEQAAEGYFSGQLPIDAPWLAGAGANMSMPRAVWESVGGFNEAYGTRWGIEDLEFAYRIWRAGQPIALCTQAIGYHMSHELTTRWEEQAPALTDFTTRCREPEVQALPMLLAASGSVTKYVEAVSKMRATQSPCAPETQA